MAARIISTVISIMMVVYIICLGFFFFQHQSIQENVEQLNYNAAELVSTSGVLDSNTYRRLIDSISIYGDFSVQLKYEKQIKPGVYDTYFDTADILDKTLSKGDRLTIYIEGKDTTIFGRLISVPFIGYLSKHKADIRIRSVKSCIKT